MKLLDPILARISLSAREDLRQEAAALGIDLTAYDAETERLRAELPPLTSEESL